MVSHGREWRVGRLAWEFPIQPSGPDQSLPHFSQDGALHPPSALFTVRYVCVHSVLIRAKARVTLCPSLNPIPFSLRKLRGCRIRYKTDIKYQVRCRNTCATCLFVVVNPVPLYCTVDAVLIQAGFPLNHAHEGRPWSETFDSRAFKNYRTPPFPPGCRGSRRGRRHHASIWHLSHNGSASCAPHPLSFPAAVWPLKYVSLGNAPRLHPATETVRILRRLFPRPLQLPLRPPRPRQPSVSGPAASVHVTPMTFLVPTCASSAESGIVPQFLLL